MSAAPSLVDHAKAITMDETQFKAYHDALQAKEEWQKELQKENRSRTDRRYTVEQQTKNTCTCDGTSILAVREWLQDIVLVRPYFSFQHQDEDTLKVVAASLQGPMRRCYERFMASQPSVTALSRQLQGLHKEMAKLQGQTLYVSPTPTPAPCPPQAAIEAVG